MNNHNVVSITIGDIIVAAFAAGSLLACNQPFDPRGPLQKELVIFSIFSNDRDMQFVRVEQSYMPAGFDATTYAGDNSITNAIVTVSGAGALPPARDTTLPRSDTSRFKFPLRAYVVSPFRAAYGGSYQIRVQAPQLPLISASVFVPTKPALAVDLSSIAILDEPTTHPELAKIYFPFTLGYGAIGYIGRFFVDYDVLIGSEWVEERVEVPIQYFYRQIEDLNLVVWPALTAAPSNSRTTVGIYDNHLYKAVLVSVAYTKYGYTKVIFNRIVFQLVQVEQNLYNYYRTAHAYSDPHSIRLDEPMYSNLTGGVGLFGAYTLDSLVHLLPERFAFNTQ